MNAALRGNGHSCFYRHYFKRGNTERLCEHALETVLRALCGIALERAVVSAAPAAGTCRNGRTTANGSAVAAAVCVVLTCEICRAGERAAGIAGHTGFLAGHYHFRRAIGQGKCGKHFAAGICKGNGLSGRNRSLGQERIAAGCFEHITAAGCNDSAAGIGDRVIAVAAVQRAVSAAGLGNKDIAAVEGNVAVGVQPVAGCIDIGITAVKGHGLTAVTAVGAAPAALSPAAVVIVAAAVGTACGIVAVVAGGYHNSTAVLGNIHTLNALIGLGDVHIGSVIIAAGAADNQSVVLL